MQQIPEDKEIICSECQMKIRSSWMPAHKAAHEAARKKREEILKKKEEGRQL